MDIGDHVKKKNWSRRQTKKILLAVELAKKIVITKNLYQLSLVNESLRKFFLLKSVICRNETELKPFNVKKRSSR